MQKNRLFKMLYYLLEKRQTTAKDLSDKFEVSIRTIYRDIDVLSMAGIPIYAQQGRNGGICLKESFVMDRALFSDQEKEEILSNLKSISLLGNTYDEETIHKLSALFNIATDDWFEVDLSRWGNYQYDNQLFQLLKRAVITHQVVNIQYVNSLGEYKQRNIHPLKLLYKSKQWYIKSFDADKEAFRTFKLSRILDCKLLETSFVSRIYQESEETTFQNDEIILKFPQSLGYRIYDEFSKENITLNEKQEFIVHVKMPIDDWFVGYLLSFKDEVDIIKPTYLKDLLTKEAKKIYEKNKT